MVDLINPNAPTITIKIMAAGQLALQTPDDKMLALSMLTIARALVERELLGSVTGMLAPGQNGGHRPA
jgi:hypothetical protein